LRLSTMNKEVIEEQNVHDRNGTVISQ